MYGGAERQADVEVCTHEHQGAAAAIGAWHVLLGGCTREEELFVRGLSLWGGFGCLLLRGHEQTLRFPHTNTKTPSPLVGWQSVLVT